MSQFHVSKRVVSKFDFAKDPTLEELTQICDDADKAEALAKAAQETKDAAVADELMQKYAREAPLQRQGSETDQQVAQRVAQQVAQDRLFAEKLMPKPVSDEFTTVGPRRRSQH
jgi:hypothetical protein